MILFENLGIQEEDLEELRRRPSVHVLCTGAMLFNKMTISDKIVCIPCGPIGNETKATILAKYALEILKIPFDQHGFEHAFASGLINDPMSIIMIHHNYEGTSEEIYEKVRDDINLTSNIISSIIGSPLFPFYELYVSGDKSFDFRMVPQAGHGSQTRTGIFQYELDNPDLASRLFVAAKREDRLSFILALVHDLIRENNPEFQIARVFNVLEAVAWGQKNERPKLSVWRSLLIRIFPGIYRREIKELRVGSRTAIRRLLNLEGDKSLRQFRHNNANYQFDPIEFSGQIRDKFYHGARIKRKNLPVKVRPGFDLMQKNPKMIVHILIDYAKSAIYSWVDEILNEPVSKG